MQRIGIRELRQQASRYIARVKDGETLEVTERGRLVALLVPPQPADAARERLIRQGRLIPARTPRQSYKGRARIKTDRSVSALLDEMREDRI